MGNITKVNVNGTSYDIKDDISGYITGITSSDVTNALGYTPYNSTNPNGYISSYTETDPTVPSWAKQSSKPSYTASEVGAVATSAVGAASGVAPLNASSKIDSTYLPSYVDDVIEGYYYNSKFYTTSAHTTEITGESGKIYVDLSTNKTYRYSGSAYIEVSQGSVVSVSRDLTSGTKIATITVDGSGSDIYAPTPPTVPSAGTTATAVGTTASGGSATTWSKSDHVHSISSSTITSALGYTPYNSTNPSGFISGITSSDVTTALGFTPYNSTNPNNYVDATGAASAAPVQSVNGQTGTVSLTIPTVPTNVSSFTNDAGYLTLATLPIYDGTVTSS